MGTGFIKRSLFLTTKQLHDLKHVHKTSNLMQAKLTQDRGMQL